MKYETMTIDQMQRFVRQMDTSLPKLIEERERILAEIKGMQDRKEILSWDEIASAVAYPKAMSDKERVSNGFSDDNKLLGQLERINKIYISQMEELCEELETVEMKVAQIRYVNRCIGRLPHDERESASETAATKAAAFFIIFMEISNPSLDCNLCDMQSTAHP